MEDCNMETIGIATASGILTGISIGVYIAIFSVVFLLIYIIQNIGYMKAINATGATGGWLAFIPIVGQYKLGKVICDITGIEGFAAFTVKIGFIIPCVNLIYPIMFVIFYIKMLITVQARPATILTLICVMPAHGFCLAKDINNFYGEEDDSFGVTE
jgi:hypothetical protein